MTGPEIKYDDCLMEPGWELGNYSEGCDRCLLLKESLWNGLCGLLAVHCVPQKAEGKQTWVLSKERCFQLSCRSSIPGGAR